MNERGGYGQYCPVAKGTEIFAERWTPLIIRELHFEDLHFNELERALPGISRSLLSQRLRRLERAGVVERRPGPGGRAKYHLTPAGQELFMAADVLGQWAVRWAFHDPQPDELDPILLMTMVRRAVSRDLLPPRRTVVQFEFRGAKRLTAWLLLEPSDVSVCLQHPGFEVDLQVNSDLEGFYRYWFGRMEFDDAVDRGLITVEGAPTGLVRAFPTWLKRSHFAPTIRAQMTGAAPGLTVVGETFVRS